MTTHETEQPDLWSAATKPEDVRSTSQRRLLPHDLDVALKYLTDGELTALAKAVEQEKLRRSPEPASSASPLQKKIFKAVQDKKDLVINTTIEEDPEVGYLISMLNEISKSDRRQGTRAVIVTADKERAKVLDEWIWAIGYHASIESACITASSSLAGTVSS